MGIEKESQLNQNFETDSSDKIADLETKVRELTAEIAADIFKKARETQGQERLRHIKRLKQYGTTVGPEKYAETLRGLMTNEAAVDELERIGRKELFEDTKNKIKKWIPWKNKSA